MNNITDSTNSTIDGEAAAPLVTTVFMSIAAILAALANLLTIAAFFTDKRCRTPFNMYLLNLACTDFLIATLDAPFTIASNYMFKWTFGFKTCTFYLYVDWILFAGAYFGVMLITVDRLGALFFPVYFRQHHSVRTSSFVCIVMWTVVHLTTCPYIIIDRMSASDDGTCFINGPAQQAYGVALLVGTGWVPMTVICLGYLLIWWKMKQFRTSRFARIIAPQAPSSGHRTSQQTATASAVTSGASAQIRRQMKRTDRRLYLTVCGLTLCIVCGWFPGMIYYALTTISSGYDNGLVYSLVLCLDYLVCLINPIVYDYNVPEIRQAVSELIRCIFQL